MTATNASLSALVFDAYGTLFDVHSVIRRCEEFWPGKGEAMSRLWRTKQLEYTWLRSLMGRYADFERVTADALGHAAQALVVDLTEAQRVALMQQYRRLELFPMQCPRCGNWRRAGWPFCPTARPTCCRRWSSMPDWRH
jgi:2-haloacid dehalogenase